MTLLFRLVGRLDDGDDLSAFRRDLNRLPETAWYDDSTGSLLVADSPVELGPLARSEVVHEVVHALADQHYRWASYRSESLPDADDRLAAFDALVEGDATYFQLLYIQQMSQADREEAALAFVDSSAAAEGVPGWVIEDLAFPFDQGFEFVADLVASGGIAAVDRAYLDPPRPVSRFCIRNATDAASRDLPPIRTMRCSKAIRRLAASSLSESGACASCSRKQCLRASSPKLPTGGEATPIRSSSPVAERSLLLSCTSATQSHIPSRSRKRLSTLPRMYWV